MDHYSSLVLTFLMSTVATANAVCLPHPSVPNGLVTYNPLSPIPQLSYNTGSIATLSCNLGFMPRGNLTTKCNQFGFWDPMLGSCNLITTSAVPTDIANLAKSCGPPMSHEKMGTVTFFPSLAPQRFQSGVVAMLSCRLGQTVVGGASQAICENGKWSTTLGFCEKSEIKIL